VLILQSDDFNRSRIATVIAVIITSNTRLAQAPGNIFLPKKLTGLPQDSVANVSQIAAMAGQPYAGMKARNQVFLKKPGF
jgi:mRNA-degrading endonuclease toxin of MazEF toxin-antitoxin module